jgi:hypothetical protein
MFSRFFSPSLITPARPALAFVIQNMLHSEGPIFGLQHFDRGAKSFVFRHRFIPFPGQSLDIDRLPRRRGGTSTIKRNDGRAHNKQLGDADQRRQEQTVYEIRQEWGGRTVASGVSVTISSAIASHWPARG